MNEAFIDVTLGSYWLVFGAAVVILVPITAPTIRKWALAAINIAFLGTLLGPRQVGAMVAAVAGLWLALRLAAGRRPVSGLVAGVLGVATLILFLAHKLPAEASRLGLGALNPILVVVGFSFVALRVCELLRGVAEGRHPAPDFASAVNYLLPFHMLAAGPIQAYDDFVAQPAVPPPLTAIEALEAAERIATGLFKKFVLAGVLKSIFLTGFSAGGPYLLLEAQVFFLWLYLDFSALSDMAVGMGRLIGVATPENFNRPYLARNMVAFWERWHISLSLFLRRHLFIPVQLTLMRRTGGKHVLACASAAFAVSFGLCGLWHSISLRFLAWGLLHAVGLIAVNLYRQFLTRRLGTQGAKEYLNNRWIRIVATFVTYEFVALSLILVFYPYPLDELLSRNLLHGYTIGR